MYISYNWLKDFVKIPAKIKPEDVARELTGHTVEVEGLLNQGEQFNKVVVGRVLEVSKHPNADRLRLTVVDIKTKKLKIVCGAPNVAAGQLVPVALIGAKLPNGVEIQESLIRGEKSCGMICAEDELGLGKNHEGILVLKDKAKLGAPFAKYLAAEDVILEIDNKSLSNRPDLLSHYGLAREVGAIFNLPLKPYEKFFQKKLIFPDKKSDKLAVKVEEAELCPRYMAVKVENIVVTESPDWLKARLIAINQRPINNIVDLTNYVMFDCGQPLHAFDAAAITKIVVRRAAKNEILETLDEKERTLNNDDLVISDGSKTLAIAGVMGGHDSGIKPPATTLIIEAANFSAAGIRRTAQKLGLRTEASIRFDKSLDPALPEAALVRFLTLLKEICPTMTLASSLIDIDNSQTKPLTINLDLNWLTKKIGQAIDRNEIVNSLTRLGFTVNSADDDNKLAVGVPSWRAAKDIATKEDLSEEVLRLYGYERIISRPPSLLMNLPEVNEERKLERKIKNILARQAALSEVYNYSFVGEDQLKKLNIDFSQHLRLANPLAENQNLLRQSLIPGLVSALKNNQFKSADLGFFEIGSVFFGAPGNLFKDSSGNDFLPYQEKHLGIGVAGSGDLFSRLKGIIDGLFRSLLLGETEVSYFALENVPGWADGISAAKIMILGQEIGLVARLVVNVAENFNLKKPLAAAEINFSRVADLLSSLAPFRFQESPKYPPVMRDLAFVVPAEVMYNDLRQAISVFNPLIRSVELFDVYSGDKIAASQKSLAFHILYQSDEKTLTAAEVDSIQRDLVDGLVKKFGGRLRDF